MELTEVGARFSPSVSDAFERLREAYKDARGESRSVLALSSVATFASNWLAPRLGLFQLEHPHIAVRLDTESRNRDFTREQVDVGIRGGFGKWPGLAAHKLMPITFTPMLSPLLLNRAGPLNEPADLLRLPIIDAFDPWWASWLESVGLPPDSLATRPRNDLESQAIAASAALAGNAVAMLTPAFFGEALRSGALVQPFEHLGSDGQNYWLVHAESRRNVAKIKAFREWLLDQFKAGPT
ncbi:LysR family transcriptional regulator [Tianweitania populi]|uniref:LysR family transcriptional regulator n=1 Tax=Tianweitania populi TaxID=1607949 RepID=A0A8J3DUH6_9HYPH|nr:LysR family transcriptional regulator [Tianweitania populi]